VIEEWKRRCTPVWYLNGRICTGETYRKVVKMTCAKGASLKDPSGRFNSGLDGHVRRAIERSLSQRWKWSGGVRFLALLTACVLPMAEPATPLPPPPPILVVVIRPDNVALAVGDSLQMEAAVVAPPSWNVVRWEWTSSNATIASVTATGLVRARSPGTVAIRAIGFNGDGHAAAGAATLNVN
jgi:Bacterial Ig-like domain (group 2)